MGADLVSCVLLYHGCRALTFALARLSCLFADQFLYAGKFWRPENFCGGLLLPEAFNVLSDFFVFLILSSLVVLGSQRSDGGSFGV